MNDTPNIEKWCEQYSKEFSVKIFPQTAPLHLIVEDVLGRIDSLRNYHDNLVSVYSSLNQRVTKLEEELIETNKMLLEFSSHISDSLKKVKK